MNIRKARSDDYDRIWEIFHKVIATGDTYVFNPDTKKEQLSVHWFAPNMTTFVAEVGGEILGTYIIKPNQVDLGSHIANCSYMVHPAAQGRGIGKQMCLHSLDYARQSGYTGMQFNCVVSTNTHAVELWKKLGFKIIGTTPKGFSHALLGYVDTFIMYCDL